MKTEFGVNHPLAVKLWSKKLLHESLKATWFSKFMGRSSSDIVQFNPELKQVGDRLTFGLRMLLTGDGVQGDATLEGNEEALQLYSDSILINQIRHAVRSGGKMSEQRVPYSIREEARQGLSDWHADRLDSAFMNQLAGNTNIADTKVTGNNATIAPTTNHWIHSTGTTEGSMSASSVFSLTLVDRAVVTAKMLSPGIRPVKVGGEEKRVMFIHPYQHYQLRANTATGQYMDIQKAAVQGGQISKNPIYTGAIAEYNGVIMHEATRVPWGTLAQAPNSKTTLGVTSVARAIMAGAQAGICCTGKNTGEGLEASWVEELFDYKNQLGVAGGLMYGLKKSVFNSTDFCTIVVSSFSPAP